MRFFEATEKGIIFRGDGETVSVRAWGKNSIRVEAVPVGDIPESSDALLTPAETTPDICIEDEKAVLVNGKITAELTIFDRRKELHICFKDRSGKILIEEKWEGHALHKRVRYFRSLEGAHYRLRAFFEGLDEKIYGMGQYQQEIFDLKGSNIDLMQRNCQVTIPFYISSRGYGFLWNLASIGEAHFGKNSIEWEARETQKLDYWVTAGDTPKEIERAYADATGHSPMMPEYGLGFWQCKLRYYTQDEVIEIAKEYKKRNIPVDVLVIDYYHWLRCGDWRFDEEFFPEPEKMIKELHDMGIETMVSIWPHVDTRSENYPEMNQQGLLVRTRAGQNIQSVFHGNNIFVDPTNSRTRKYVWGKVKKNYWDLGIRTFWLDSVEPDSGDDDYNEFRYAIGNDLEKGNLYPREYEKMFYDGQKSAGQDDIVNLCRCAWAGSQQYGVLVWSGDIFSTYDDFRKQICAGLHMGLAGIPWWTTDIGGFHGGNIYDPKFQELLIRWFEYGTFCPVMRIHGSRQPFTQIYNKAGELREQTGAPNEIWSYGEENERIMTKFIRIRELMKDYVRETMAEASEDGDPVMRTLFYEFPEDEKTYDIMDEYMFGSDILVAPVCYEGAVSREVYLPKGASWTLAGTGEVYEGGKAYEIDAPIDTLPIFLRDGKQAYLVGKI